MTQGIILGALTFILIGMFHPIVIKSEYHFGTRVWPIFLIVGIGCIIAAYFINDMFWSTLVSIVGFCSLWSIHEIFEQRERVRKGWFPKKKERK